MNRALRISVGIEVATGVALIIVPAIVVRLLFGVDVSGAAVILARIAGIALLSLGLACWPGHEPVRPASVAMLTYNLLVAVYLLAVGVSGAWVGVLFWPAAGLHAVLAILLARAALLAHSPER